MTRPVLSHLKTQHILKHNHLKSTKLVTTPFQLRLLQLAIAGMAIISVIWLGYEFWRLLFQDYPLGAIDLRLRHKEVAHWFSGAKVYYTIGTAIYPPASYALFWPLTGWLSLTATRWLWALTTIIALFGISAILIRTSALQTKKEIMFTGLMPLAIYATGASIGNGQLPIHVLFAIIFAAILLKQTTVTWQTSAIAAALFIFALIKPTMSAPFFWVFLFAFGTIRPGLMILSGYAGLSVFAGMFQPGNIIELHQQWLDNALKGVTYGSSRGGGNINLHGLLNDLGLNGWNLDISLIMIFVLGAWTFWHRKIDIWLQLGVASLVARFWTYHMWYDDLLILIPMFAIFRIMLQQKRDGIPALTAGILFGIAMLFSIAPGGLYLFPEPFNMIYVFCQKIIWHAMLFYLLFQSHVQQRAVNHPQYSESQHKPDAIIIRQKPKLRTGAF